jgi:hypothetical membrane protein
MKRPDYTLKYTAICGILGPIIYAIVIGVMGALYPGYSHISQSMSELGATGAPHAVIINTLSFPLLGLFFFIFAFTVHRSIEKNKASLIGPCLVVLSGFSLVMTGIFQCDPGCVDVSWRGRTHSVFATIAAVSFSLGRYLLPSGSGQTAAGSHIQCFPG